MIGETFLLMLYKCTNVKMHLGGGMSSRFHADNEPGEGLKTAPAPCCIQKSNQITAKSFINSFQTYLLIATTLTYSIVRKVSQKRTFQKEHTFFAAFVQMQDILVNSNSIIARVLTF